MAAEKTRRKAKLGRYMQALRKKADPTLNPNEVAERVHVAATTITRMEGGYSQPTYAFFAALCGIYGASDRERAEVEQLWQHAKQGSTIVENAADLPPKYRAFRRDESDAELERTIDMIAVPGLLQTADYARALRRAARRHIKGNEWEQRAAEERRSRQRLLDGDNSFGLHAVLDEGVIRRVIGGKEVMAEQLQYLLDMAKKPNVTIQIVPYTAGAYSTMAGTVILLHFADDADPDVAYLEYAGGGETVDNESDVQAFAETFDDVSKNLALTPEKSVRLIRAALHALKEP